MLSRDGSFRFASIGAECVSRAGCTPWANICLRSVARPGKAKVWKMGDDESFFVAGALGFVGCGAVSPVGDALLRDGGTG